MDIGRQTAVPAEAASMVNVALVSTTTRWAGTAAVYKSLRMGSRLFTSLPAGILDPIWPSLDPYQLLLLPCPPEKAWVWVWQELWSYSCIWGEETWWQPSLPRMWVLCTQVAASSSCCVGAVALRERMCQTPLPWLAGGRTQLWSDISTR